MDPQSSSSTGAAAPDDPPFAYVYMLHVYLAYNVASGVGLGLLIAYLPPHLLSNIINKLWSWPLIMESVRATKENQEQFGDAQDDETSRAMEHKEADDEDDDDEGEGPAAFPIPRKTTYSLSNSSSLAQPLNSSSALVVSSVKHASAQVDEISDRLYMRPVPGRLLVMGRAVQLSNEDSTDPSLAPHPFPRSLWSRLRLWLLSCLYTWVPSTFRHRSLSTRIVRIVRRLLWIHTWSAVLYLLDLCVIRISRFEISHPPLTDFDTRCPAETLGSYCFDHFSFKYVSCYNGAEGFVPRGTKLLECYEMLSLDASAIVAGIATVAALYSLVFGGVCAVATWAVGTVDRVWLLWCLYAVPLFGIVMLEYAFFAAKVTSVIVLFVTITAIVSFSSMLRIRLLIIERNTKGGMDDRWADAFLSAFGCARCIAPPNPVLTTMATKDFHTVDLYLLSSFLSVMSARALIDVEWQLVMHFLPSSDLLRLGRCSSQLSRCAATPFAWSCTALSVRSTPQRLKDQLAQKSALFAFAPLALVLLPPYMCDRTELLSKVQAQKLRRMNLWRLRSLDCTPFRSVAYGVWQLLLDDRSALRHLRVLIMHDLYRYIRATDVNAELVTIIASMPHLHTLQIDPKGLDSAALTPLASAPCLTDLRITASDYRGSSRLEQIATCPLLQSLLLHGPRAFTATSFRALFAAPMTSRLRRLVLYGASICISPDPVEPDDFRRAMSAMSCLREFRLIKCDHIQPMIPHLMELPVIQLLLFELDGWMMAQAANNSREASSSVPLVNDLCLLLEAKPDLRCVIQMPSVFRKEEHDAKLRAWCEPMITRFGHRAELNM